MNKTSEWVSLGHSDKTADYIASFMLDRVAASDKFVRYAVECMVKGNNVYLCGEASSCGFLAADNLLPAVKEAMREIGYTEEYARLWNGMCISPENIHVHSDISEQSPDIGQGVDKDAWGDQGVFCGLAVNAPSHEYMPLDIWTAREVGMALYEASGRYGWGIDIKTQVTVNSEGEIPQVVVAVPLRDGCADSHDVEEFVNAKCDEIMLPRPKSIIVNGTGKYVMHSSFADCGVTGRKLGVDLYGMNAEIGGGSLWGKDYTKADVTLNAYARKLALDFTRRHGCACKCRISCVIGRREIEVVYTTMQNRQISRHVRESYPSLVASALGLDRPVYARICRKGMPYYVAEEC